MLWTIGITPRRQWQRAEAAGRLDIDIPTNHNPGFLPDLSTLQVSTRAAAVAILACLQSEWEKPEAEPHAMGAPVPTDEEIDAVAVETSLVE